MAQPGREQRYAELLQQIGGALMGAAPPGWRRIDLMARIAEGVQDFGLSVIMADGSYAEVDPPPRAAHALVELRRLMAEPRRGAWFSARYLLNAPSEFRVFYNYDHDPAWQPPIPPAYFQQDLAAHPRAPENVPPWLRDLLGHPPLPPDPTPLGLDRQSELTSTIADLLVLRAPADRDQVRAMYRAAGDHEELITQVIDIDGQLREWPAPAELAGLFRTLRAGMASAGHGTWSAVSAVVEWPIRTSLNYLYTEDPRWRQPPSRYAVMDDLERFPRKPEHVPEWMTTILPTARRVAEVAGRFRQARIFDRRDADGRPIVNRPPVPQLEVPQLVAYLNDAHVLMAGRGFDTDLFDPNGARDVPAGFHTDGTWIWPAALPHYLAKHGVPPEPDLVAHARAAGFTPPRVDRDTANAAYTALTGEVPAPSPSEPEQPELSDRDRQLLSIIERRLSETGALPRLYQLLGSAEGAMCLEQVEDEWQVALYERGKARAPLRFAHLWDAGAYLLGYLTFSPAQLRGGGKDTNTARALNDWPVQPLPGEPPLTLLAGKRIVVLMPDRELVRYGEPAGNLTFAAGTEFAAMSLRAEREQQGPRRYRVIRELRALAGTTVPWHDQPGGGPAYLLPRSVEAHVADGSLTEVTDG
jgi:nicrotizing toxin Mtb-like protein